MEKKTRRKKIQERVPAKARNTARTKRNPVAKVTVLVLSVIRSPEEADNSRSNRTTGRAAVRAVLRVCTEALGLVRTNTEPISMI